MHEDHYTSGKRCRYVHIIYPHYIPTSYTHTIYSHHIPTPYTHIIYPHHMSAPPAGAKWERYMPSWPDCGHRRGRLHWGSFRDKQGEIHDKKWAEPKLCRTPVTKAIRKYFETIGLPATIAGESFVTAVKEGRYDLTTSPSKLPRGQTRGQMRLVPCMPPDDINWQSVFVCVTAAEYCKQLKVHTI